MEQKDIDLLISEFLKLRAKYEALGSLLGIVLSAVPKAKQDALLVLPHMKEEWIDIGLNPLQVQVAEREVRSLCGDQ